ncbi:Undecaprenyl-phosphate 4-deoxy-4-formamido-L-arabinose transferase [anaerobic digester metagenome]
MSWTILMLFLLIASLRTKKKPEDMTVSVIIPAYNESNTIEHVVNTVRSINYVSETIVVDDGSTDDTAEIAETAGAKVIKHSTNKGKGAAIKTGFKKSNGDIAVFLDGDLHTLTVEQVEKIIKPILNGEADITKTKFKREAGRVTELTAKPLLKFFFPELKFDQPLSGQFAAKRSFLNSINLEDDYGVDVGIVLDADVRGMRVKEVDIGKIDHVMSSLSDLNVVATEVVRTIVDRAMEYGRVTMMDSLGKAIRMGILGLSLITLGVFCIFFIRFIPLNLGLVIAGIGAAVAIFYIARIIRMSFKVIRRSEVRFQTIRSFFYMHSPIIVSGLILIAMLTTLLGAVHVDDGKISIQPNSRNLIIWNQPHENQSIDVRGPYTIDSAVENEYGSMRMPQEALNTLELNYGDSIYINDQKYNITSTLPGEDNIIRTPYTARNYLGIQIGDSISDSDLRNVFKNLYVEKALPLSDQNITMDQGFIIKTNNEPGRIVNIYVNNQKVATTVGVLKNGTYTIYVDGSKYKTIQFNDQNPNKTYSIYMGNSLIKVEIGDRVPSDMEFAQSDEGKFLNFVST